MSESAVAPAKKIEFDDPHVSATADLRESEVTRVRALRVAWRWA